MYYISKQSQGSARDTSKHSKINLLEWRQDEVLLLFVSQPENVVCIFEDSLDYFFLLAAQANSLFTFQ